MGVTACVMGVRGQSKTGLTDGDRSIYLLTSFYSDPEFLRCAPPILRVLILAIYSEDCQERGQGPQVFVGHLGLAGSGIFGSGAGRHAQSPPILLQRHL